MDDGQRTRDPERTRAAIFDAARDVFVERGYQGASIRAIAERAGFTHGTIYLYFRDKEDLLQQLAEDRFQGLRTDLRRIPRTTDPLARLRDIVMAIIEFGLAHPGHYRLMLSLHAPHAGMSSPYMQEVVVYLQEALEVSHRRGLISSDDLVADAHAILAMLHGVIDLTHIGIIDAGQARTVTAMALKRIVTGLQHSTR